MTGKEEQELYENICNDINCGTFILAPQYVNKLLAKLEKENAELKNKIADIKANCDLAIEGRDVKVMELEKENKILTQNLEDTEIINKTLGERCNQLLADKGKLTDELDKWKAEWNDQVIKANEEGFARTKQTIQLSKAKELIKTLLLIADNKVSQIEFQLCIADAKQFLSEVEK